MQYELDPQSRGPVPHSSRDGPVTQNSLCRCAMDQAQSQGLHCVIVATYLVSLGRRFQGVVAASNNALDVWLPWRIEARRIVWGKAILTQGEEGFGNGLFLGYRCVLFVLEDDDVCYGCRVQQ